MCSAISFNLYCIGFRPKRFLLSKNTYAGSKELYAEFSETEGLATVCVTNDGKQPEREIVEGGGLSTLRRRVERAGGTMVVQSLLKFKLIITVPKGKVCVL